MKYIRVNDVTALLEFYKAYLGNSDVLPYIVRDTCSKTISDLESTLLELVEGEKIQVTDIKEIDSE